MLNLPGMAAPCRPLRVFLHVFLCALPLMMALLPAVAAAAPRTETPRVETMYTTWDDFYFYAAFRVHDTNVLGTNTTTTSQPQEDDDVELFFETDDARARVRTPQTYQMAISAAQGAYFSVGDGSKTPVGKAVYSYKYVAAPQGTLNKPDDTDTGFDVEVAIPWTEMGLSGPPQPGATWGFNVISRDRESANQPADKFYSLSGKVRGKADVQNPSKWAQIAFVAGGAGTASSTEKIICAKVVGSFPRVNGVIVSGDWPASTRLAFGTDAIQAPAPTLAEEPNTKQSAFDNPPAISAPPGGKPIQTATGTIDMPGGGIIKIVPGGIKNPFGMEPPVVKPAPPKPSKKPGRAPVQTARNTEADSIVVNRDSFVLGTPKPPAFVMGIYRVDFNGDPRKGPPQNVWAASGATLLADQPMNGAGPWFSGLRPLWHRQQLTDLRRSGLEVALLRARPDDALLPRELDALVQALKEMKAAGQEYPLVGVDATTGQPDLDLIYAHLPAEFRAMQDVPGQTAPGVVVYDLALGSTDSQKALADGTPIARVYYNNGVASVSPGRLDKNGILLRKGGRTYDTSWQVAMVSTPSQIVVDSWNDFLRGTEIAASRQYGEQYADATRASVIAYDGSRPWHAKYLAHTTPRTIYPKTLYQIPLLIENAGTLPWRAGEGYSLSTRWYRNGKLYDDSAPRIPVGKDVLPGHALTLSVGLVARDNAGEDLEPGDYTLVVDMVQGQDRWFSYAGDTPLQVPVTVIAADAGIGTALATFLETQTPAVVQSGASVTTVVSVRNDGASAWPTGYTLGYKIQSVDPDGSNPKMRVEGKAALGEAPVSPGQIAAVSLPVPAVDADGKPLPPGMYRLHWFVRPDAEGSAVSGAYDETLTVSAPLPGVSFLAVDLPRTLDAGKDGTARIALRNIGPDPLLKGKVQIGYHWYALDGTELAWDAGQPVTLDKDIAPGAVDDTLVATFRAPARPGRYGLVWDARTSGGAWQSTLPVTVGNDLLQVFVTVGGKGEIVPVDLNSAFNAVAIASGGVSKTGGFDSKGSTLPAEMVPPDGTAEVDGNPFALGRPGPPLYPSGYYTAQSGAKNGNHTVSFLYPAVRDGQSNVVSCTGQTISLPSGKYKAIHLLAVNGTDRAASVIFSARYDRDMLPLPVTVIAPWTELPSGENAAPGYTAPYIYADAGVRPQPVTLGDYTLKLDTGKKLTGLVLPNTQSLKIVAISLEKE